MSATLIAKRYAKALFKMTSGKSDAEKLAAELGGANALFKVNEARKILMSPVMPPDLKKKLLDYGLQTSAASERAINIANELVKVGRIHLFPMIFEEFNEILRESTGVIKADVSTAVEIGDQEENAIKSSLEDLFKKKVTIEKHVDKDQLGGTVIRVGNYLIDMSLKTKVRNLSQSFATN